MSETDPAAEYEPEVMSVIKRYYNDIYYSKDTYATAITALSSLLDKFTEETSIDTSALANGQYHPTEYEFENNSRIAKEKLALLPLVYLGPLLEGSDITTDEVTNWYSDAIYGVRMLTQEDHNEDCIVPGAEATLICEKSDVCPHKFMVEYLTADMMTADFDYFMYEIDKERMYRIAAGKLGIGIDQDLVLPNFAKTIGSTYYQEYRHRFYSE